MQEGTRKCLHCPTKHEGTMKPAYTCHVHLGAKMSGHYKHVAASNG